MVYAGRKSTEWDFQDTRLLILHEMDSKLYNVKQVATEKEEGNEKDVTRK